MQRIEFATPHRVQQCRAFDQVVARGGKQPRFGNPLHGMTRAPGALQECGNRPRRRKLADQVDLADVDTELQRCGRDQCAQLSRLQAALGVEALFLRQAAVMRGDRILAEPFGEMARRAFDRAAGVGEDQRGAVLFDQSGEVVVYNPPRVVAHHRLQRDVRQFDCKVTCALVAGVDGGAGPVGGEEPRDLFNGFLRGRQPDARAVAPAQRIQSLQRQREMTAAFTLHQRMDFIDDHRARGLQHATSRLRTQQDIQRFGGGHHDVRRALAHCVALGLGRIAGAYRGADFDVGRTRPFEFSANAFDRNVQVDAHVVGQRLQRRHVHDGSLIGKGSRHALLHEFVDRGQECRKRLARARGCSDQHVAAGPDRGPRVALRLSRRGKRGFEPGSDGGVEELHDEVETGHK